MSQVIIKNIDFTQLKKQKATLLAIIARQEDKGASDLEMEEAKDMEGVVNLIDAIQDYEVDVNGRDESEVFDFTEEGE